MTIVRRELPVLRMLIKRHEQPSPALPILPLEPEQHRDQGPHQLYMLNDVLSLLTGSGLIRCLSFWRSHCIRKTKTKTKDEVQVREQVVPSNLIVTQI